MVEKKSNASMASKPAETTDDWLARMEARMAKYPSSAKMTAELDAQVADFKSSLDEMHTALVSSLS